MELRTDSGGEPDLPEIEPELRFLVNYLFDAGPTSAAGQHGSPLSWADLQAWQLGIGVCLPAWILRLMRRLSGDYLAESFVALAYDAPPPWNRDADRARIGQHIKNVMRS